MVDCLAQYSKLWHKVQGIITLLPYKKVTVIVNMKEKSPIFAVPPESLPYLAHINELSITCLKTESNARASWKWSNLICSQRIRMLLAYMKANSFWIAWAYSTSSFICSCELQLKLWTFCLFIFLDKFACHSLCWGSQQLNKAGKSASLCSP